MPPPVVTRDGGNSSAQRNYTYAPTLRGSNSGSMTFTPSAGFVTPPTATIKLTGQGVAPVIGLDTSAASAGNVRIGTAANANVKVLNNGDGNQAGGGLGNLVGTVSGNVNGFTGSGGSFSLADGANQLFTYTFSPGGHSSSSGTVAVNASNGSSDGKNLAQNFTVNLSGTGVGPTVDTSLPANTTVNFGQLVPSQTASQTLTVSNVTLDPDLAGLTNLTLRSATINEPSGKTMYSLLGYTSGMVLAKSQLANLQLAFTPAGGFLGTEMATFTLVTDEGAALGATGKTVSFPLMAVVADVAYWKGANGTAWNAAPPGSNWTTAADGATPLSVLPGVTTDVYFSAASAANLDTTLGNDFSIHSLNFTAGTGTVSIGGSNTLTLSNGVTTAGNTAGYAINANMQLAASQTWAITGPGQLTVAGAIGGSGGLIKSGSGVLILAGPDNYSGGTTVSAGELIVVHPYGLADGSTLTIGRSAQFVSATPFVAAPSAAAQVPEPRTVVLLAALGLIAMLPGQRVMYRSRRSKIARMKQVL
jgi:autotransporter-associated beta strand protein